MNKLKVIIFFLAVCGVQKAASQKLTMYKTFGGVIYMLNDSTELSINQTRTLLFTHPQAYSEFKKARTWSTISAVSGFAGAAMVAIPVATLAFGENADWGFAIGGSLLIGGALVSNLIYKARALNALDIYNADLPQKTSRIKPEFYFYGTGAKLVIKF